MNGKIELNQAIKNIKAQGYSVEQGLINPTVKGTKTYGGKLQITIVNPLTNAVVYDRTENANYPIRHADKLEQLGLPNVEMPSNTIEITEDTDIEALLKPFKAEKEVIDSNFNIFDWFENEAA